MNGPATGHQSPDAGYWAHLEATAVPRTGRNAGLLVLVILAIATLGDLPVVPLLRRSDALSARALGIGWTAAHTALAHFLPDAYRVHYRWLLVAFMWIVGVMCSAIGTWANALGDVYLLGVVQAQFGYATFIPLRRHDMAIGTVGSALLFLATPAALGQPLSAAELSTIIPVLAIFAILALYAHRQLLGSRVAEFDQSQQLLAARDGLEREVADRTRELSEAVERLVQSEASARDLARSVVKSREAESSRIGRELHDELGQLLTGLRIGAGVLGRRLRREQHEPGAVDADRLAAIADDAVRSVRAVARELRPTMLDDLGLVPALESLVRTFGERTGIACSLAAEFDESVLDSDQRTAFYRVAQEALTNIARHAGGTSASVSLQHANGTTRLVVEDNGVGAAAESLTRPTGMGVRGMRERALSVGGTLTVTGVPGIGTRVCLELRTDVTP